MNIEPIGTKLRLAFIPQFQKALPDVKVLRYYQIESKINAALMYELAALEQIHSESGAASALGEKALVE